MAHHQLVCGILSLCERRIESYLFAFLQQRKRKCDDEMSRLKSFIGGGQYLDSIALPVHLRDDGVQPKTRATSNRVVLQAFDQTLVAVLDAKLFVVFDLLSGFVGLV